MPPPSPRIPLVGPTPRVVLSRTHNLDHLEVHAPATLDTVLVDGADPLPQLTVRGAPHIRHLEVRATMLSTLSAFEVESIDEVVVDRVPTLGGWSLPTLTSVDTIRLDRVQDHALQPFRTVRDIRHLELRSVGLRTLQPLQALDRLQSLTMAAISVADLKDLDGLPPMTRLNVQTAPLFRSLEGFPPAEALDALWLLRTDVKTLEPLTGLVRIHEDLQLSNNNALRDLTGLDQLEEIGGNLIITHNASLADLTALHGTTVEGTVVVEGRSLSPQAIDELRAAIAQNNQARGIP